MYNQITNDTMLTYGLLGLEGEDGVQCQSLSADVFGLN